MLLTHDAPIHGIRWHYGSELVDEVIKLTEPAFAFFGHYKGTGKEIEGEYGSSRVYHLSGMELMRWGRCAEPSSVGVLSWDGDRGSFEYVDEGWLRTFTRDA